MAPMHLLRHAAMAAAVAAALTACGGGDGGTAPTPTPTQTPTPSRQPVVVEVTIGAFFQYEPDPVEVSVGTTVKWTNPQNVFHSATTGTCGADDCEADGTFDGPMPEQGDSTEFTFTEAGSYTYFCTRHTTAMKGEVVVTAK